MAKRDRHRRTREAAEEEIKLELTPMIDITFLILIFFMLMPFKTLEGKLLAFLPTDKGIQPIPQDPVDSFDIDVHVIPREHKDRDWGPENNRSTVKMPSKVVYKVKDRETEKIEEVGKWVKEMIDTARAQGITDDHIKCEIRAGHKIPFKYVIAVLNQFNELRVTKVEFYGTQIPAKNIREAGFLPYPKANWVGEEAHR
ncbi:MAG: biopolymer transporter ExbD [Planctomycetota bacterium]|nr:biopolymer transporter ExbD [Planctomycetota bacterium]